MTYFERALPIREKVNVPGETADTLHNLAEAAVKMGQDDKATADTSARCSCDAVPATRAVPLSSRTVSGPSTSCRAGSVPRSVRSRKPWRRSAR